jgi:hypothetical protein
MGWIEELRPLTDHQLPDVKVSFSGAIVMDDVTGFVSFGHAFQAII